MLLDDLYYICIMTETADKQHIMANAVALIKNSSLRRVCSLQRQMASISSLAITHSHVITHSGHFEMSSLKPEGLMKLEQMSALCVMLFVLVLALVLGLTTFLTVGCSFHCYQ